MQLTWYENYLKMTTILKGIFPDDDIDLVNRPEQALMYHDLDLSASAFLLAAEHETSLGTAAARCGATDDATLGRIIALALQLRLLAQSKAVK